MAPRSAIPTFYYIFFGIYEPILTVTGFLGALADPKKTHDGQAPWVNNPPEELPLATRVTIIQLAHVCGLLGVINAFVLRACRKHLAFNPALQEKIVRALMWPLVVGDALHVGVTLWALGDKKWDVGNWSGLLWTTLLLGMTLFIPRIMWHLGIWRYVHSRDGHAVNGSVTMKQE
ncbi:uncharacterized protein FOMMEDRAFT_158257 [Fomitiporia mediterranea MF3/22]|uniref:uncharacterized protein n=1 Tax=Fomitiporia mediterranea (strain MF3/22) TaxID=694068 RepID=UPI0004407823|nr:uncharacterized protein FOMMEDRAFT_158257 [Fomitiporia mediterranea MF3/22]EJD01123.1 hypothetical protein FOMMEDRAFT_158257 [Fomitiporia mediterranea MF3/22]